jgi:zinc/manganese transport system permease protein
MPAAAAQGLTARPWLSVALAVLIGVVVTWLALAVAFYTPYPVGFYVTTFGFGFYLLAGLFSLVKKWRVSAGARGSGRGSPALSRGNP